MSYQEKTTIAHLLSIVLVVAGYGYYVQHTLEAGGFDGPDGLSLLGKIIVGMIFAGIAISIAVAILTNIVFGIAEGMATGTPEPMVADERDRTIEQRSVQFATYALGIGFIGSMVALAMGQPPFIVFNLIVLSGAGADILGSIVKLVLYRRGF